MNSPYTFTDRDSWFFNQKSKESLHAKLKTPDKNNRMLLYFGQMVGNGIMAGGGEIINYLEDTDSFNGTRNTGIGNVIRQGYVLAFSKPDNLRKITEKLNQKRHIAGYSFQLLSDEKRAKINHTKIASIFEAVGSGLGIGTNAFQALQKSNDPNATANAFPGQLMMAGYSLMTTAIAFGQIANKYSDDFVAYNLAYLQLSDDDKKTLQENHSNDITSFSENLLAQEKKNRRVEKTLETVATGCFAGRAFAQFNIGAKEILEVGMGSANIGQFLLTAAGCIFLLTAGATIGGAIKAYDRFVDPMVKLFQHKQNAEDITKSTQKNELTFNVDALPQKIRQKCDFFKNDFQEMAKKTRGEQISTAPAPKKRL